MVLGIVGLVAVGWVQYGDQMRRLEARIDQLEADVRILTPLITVMAGARNPEPILNAYEAVQACGPADVPEGGGDNALAWCQAVEDGGAEWLELIYETSVTAKELRIHASFNPGAVVRVLAGKEDGEMMVVWSGDGVTEAIQAIQLSSPLAISRVRLELDTSKVPGWNEIDAVALENSSGSVFWATGATASSVWSKASDK